jgi:membrane-associated phospholipid phosphatase
MRYLRRIRHSVLSMRPEECATLLLFLPMALALAGLAREPAAAPVHPAAANYPDPLARLITLLGSVVVYFWVARTKPQWKLVRDALPFLFCANIYANLHDLIRFYNRPDITLDLYRWDMVLFGVEPTLWAQRFAHPFLTDFFTACYWTFYFMPPLLGLFLYLKRDRPAFRSTMVSVVLCLYLGYIGYVVWPASAPRLAIPEQYGAPLDGFSAALDYTRGAVAAIPLTAHGAFPSLHCAVAFLSVLLSWRHLRWMFPVQLFAAVGLIFGTVYLRHHWVVDIAAGFALTFFAFWAGPRIERWWERAAARYGVPMAWAPAPQTIRGDSRTGAPSSSQAS